jgi:hypothetical protein
MLLQRHQLQRYPHHQVVVVDPAATKELSVIATLAAPTTEASPLMMVLDRTDLPEPKELMMDEATVEDVVAIVTTTVTADLLEANPRSKPAMDGVPTRAELSSLMSKPPKSLPAPTRRMH